MSEKYTDVNMAWANSAYSVHYKGVEDSTCELIEVNLWRDKVIENIFTAFRLQDYEAAKRWYRILVAPALLEKDFIRVQYESDKMVRQFISKFRRMGGFADYSEYIDYVSANYGEIIRCEDIPQIKRQLCKAFRDVVAYYQDAQRNHSYSELTEQAIKIVDEAEDYQTLTVASIAEELGRHPNYLSRVFRNDVGITLIGYISRKKFFEAINLLRTTDLSVAEIAERLGYADMRGFYKMFKKYTNIPCSDFRDSIVIKDFLWN